MSANAVGIDLGTTNSCVAICRNDSVEIIENQEGERVTPSWVTFTEDVTLTGSEAVDNCHAYLKTTVYEAKRLIGQKFTDSKVQEDIRRFPYTVFDDLDTPKIRIELGGETREYYPEEISAFILQKLKTVAEDRLKAKVVRAVVTVPAYFNDAQRQATKDAAFIAGFEVVNVINEPTAAALAFNRQHKKSYKRNVVVYDFGGGTFDVSIVTLGRGACTVKATKGDSHLGGTDIDMRLVRFVEEDFKKRFGRDLGSNRDQAYKEMTQRRLKTMCEKAKKKLSGGQYQTNIELSDFSGEDYIFSLSRARLEQLNEDLFKRTMLILEQCLADSKLTRDDIDEVVLVGGSSKIPKIQELLADYFGKGKINKGVNPDEAVAYGAAIQATNLAGDKNEVKDVTSLSLGTNTYGDMMSFIIPRNTPIPAKATKRYQTIMDDQTTMEFPVYQGERAIASENYELGSFTMVGLTEAPAKAVKVEVCYELDAEGLLHVSAVEINADNKKEVLIDIQKRGLTGEQIQERILEAQTHREQDLKRRRFNEEKYELESLLNEAKAHAEQCNENDKNDLLDCHDDICRWLETATFDDLDEIKEKQQNLKDLIDDVPTI